MADERKRRKRSKTTSGRVTEPSTASRRYTPPVPGEYKRTPRWVPIFMFGFFGLGVLVIILNYLPNSPFLPESIASSWYLLIGLGLICIGFIFATKYE